MQASGKITLIFKEGHDRIKIDVNIDGSAHVSEQPLTKQTPYYKHFKSIVDKTGGGNKSGTHNSYHSPDIYKFVTGSLHVHLSGHELR